VIIAVNIQKNSGAPAAQPRVQVTTRRSEIAHIAVASVHWSLADLLAEKTKLGPAFD